MLSLVRRRYLDPLLLSLLTRRPSRRRSEIICSILLPGFPATHADYPQASGLALASRLAEDLAVTVAVLEAGGETHQFESISAYILSYRAESRTHQFNSVSSTCSIWSGTRKPRARLPVRSPQRVSSPTAYRVLT